MIGRAAAAAAAALLLVAAPAAAAPSETLSADAAYARIAKDGLLRGVRVTGDLDLERLLQASEHEPLVLRRVQLDGTLRLGVVRSPKALNIEDCSLGEIDGVGARVSGGLSVTRSHVSGFVQLTAAELMSGLIIDDSSVASATFREAVFRGPVEIYRSTFNEAEQLSCTSFEDARFHSTLRFDDTTFNRDLSMRSAVVAEDATFLHMIVKGAADFSNVNFRQDAEFRYCNLGPTTFGGADAMAAFSGLADFRGCKLQSARFDYAEFRGDALWSDVTVAGDMSLRKAALHGAHSDFIGLRVDGSLQLEDAYLGNLILRWHPLEGALLRAAPSSSVLWNVYGRLVEHGGRAERQRAFGAASLRQFSETLNASTSSSQDVFLACIEHGLWGWPTGYGTNLPHILGLSAGLWLGLSLVLWWLLRRGTTSVPFRIVKVERSEQRESIALVMRDEGSLAAAPERVATLTSFLGYTARMMFMPWSSVRLRGAPSPIAQYGVQLVHGVGLYLLALIVLTLRSVSPALEAIFGVPGTLSH
jgi:uncharacterized protein YjbI with pentapeptide repeats